MENGTGATEQDLIRKLAGFDLNEDEETSAVLYEDDIREGLQECENSCLGKVFAPKEIPLKYLRMSMVKAWKCESLKVIKLDTNIYQIFLRNTEEVERLLSQGPWCFDNCLMSIVKWERGANPKTENFHLVKFWLQLSGLPRELYTKEVGRKLAGLLKECEEIQIRETQEEESRKFFRLRAMVDVTQPLRRTIKVTTPFQDQHTGILRYERLPHFCFQCGRVGHTTKGCLTGKKDLSEEEKAKLQFGRWLYTETKKSTLVSSFGISADMEYVVEEQGQETEFSPFYEGQQMVSLDQLANISGDKAEENLCCKIPGDAPTECKPTQTEPVGDKQMEKITGKSPNQGNKENIPASDCINTVELCLGISEMKKGRRKCRSVLQVVDGNGGQLCGQKRRVEENNTEEQDEVRKKLKLDSRNVIMEWGTMAEAAKQPCQPQ